MYAKLEIFLNSILISIGHAIVAAIPQSFKTSANNVQSYIQNKKEQVAQRRTELSELSKNRKEKLRLAHKSAKLKVKKFKEIDMGTRMLEARVRTSIYWQNISFKLLFASALGVLTWPKRVLASLGAKVTANQLAVAITLTSVSTVAGITMYKASNQIYQDVQRSRHPASGKPAIPELIRPAYYKAQTKQFEIGQLKLPLYVSSMNGIKTMTLDFKIKTTNRRTLQYINKNEFMIRDWLMMNVEPIKAEFPLEPEGRDIIKDKIKRELNSFLDKNQVEGSIDDIQLVYVLGT